MTSAQIRCHVVQRGFHGSTEANCGKLITIDYLSYYYTSCYGGGALQTVVFDAVLRINECIHFSKSISIVTTYGVYVQLLILCHQHKQTHLSNVVNWQLTLSMTQQTEWRQTLFLQAQPIETHSPIRLTIPLVSGRPGPWNVLKLIGCPVPRRGLMHPECMVLFVLLHWQSDTRGWHGAESRSMLVCLYRRIKKGWMQKTDSSFCEKIHTAGTETWADVHIDISRAIRLLFSD